MDELLERWLDAIDREDLQESERLAKFILANLDLLLQEYRDNIKKLAEETLANIEAKRKKEQLIEEIMKPK